VTSRQRPDQLIQTFGTKSPLARAAASILCRSLEQSFADKPSGVPARLFEVWRNQFGLQSIADRRSDNRRNRIDAWRRKWLGSERNIDADIFLFAVQSYYAFTLKLLAARLTGTEALAGDVASWGSIESGKLFRDRGVANLVNGDVFQSAIHTSDQNAVQLLKETASQAFAVPLDALMLSTSLRSLYLDLFPREVRHALGEYYTPSLLVEHVLDVVGFDPADDRRVLDPMCGGGAFLSAILAKRRFSGRRTGADQLDLVAGIELHPLAALTARVALFSQVADLQCDRPLTIPIHQGDSILAAWNRRQPTTSSILRIASPLGTLEIPNGSSAEQQVIDAMVEAGVFGDAAAMVADARGLAAIPPFDVIVGNPPWIGWESLSAEYRRATTPIWQAYGLFQHRGMETILGGGKKDLSMLATYAAADAWLKPGGRLGFVVTESAFKSVGAARGFRRFQIGDDQTDALKVVRVDDLTRLDPFANAATRSTILLLEKGASTIYPVPFIRWNKTGKRNAVAEPIDPSDRLSPWVAATPTVLPLLRRMLGESAVRAYEGINTGGANGVYWLRVLERTKSGTVIVENDPLFGRSNVPTIRAEIESTYLYPLLRHQDVGRWITTSELSILMLQDTQRRRGIDLQELKANAPKTLDFIGRFEELLRKRAAYKRYFTASNGRSASFYTMFNVGTYTLAPIKVVWRRMIAPLEAAVVVSEGSKPPLPQETLCFIPCSDCDEAFYYAGLLNSKTVNVAALAATQGSSKSFGAPHLLKLVQLPTFDCKNDAHRRLVEIAQNSDRSGDDLDRVVAEVHGFTEVELSALLEEHAFLTT
jgi:hypothetical protein